MRRDWAGFPAGQPLVMGILNITPDSFSDGGRNLSDPLSAGLAMIEAGADIIDIGGESTRPGAPAVPVADEIERVRPVICALARAGATISIDTRNAETMRVALGEGARIINDVSAFRHDPNAASVAASARCPVVLMHMRGGPEDMADLVAYQDVVADVREELRQRVREALMAGVAAESICIDPGIGFAKTGEQNIQLLRHLPAMSIDEFPRLVGVSRKGFIGQLSGEPDPAKRAGGSVAAALWALQRGADILRVHDVAETVQAIRVWRGLAGLR